jgi:hypothetical protein
MKFYIESFNSLGESENTTRKRGETLLLADWEAALEANYDDAGRTFTSCQQNAGRTQNIKTSDRSFQNVATSKHYGATLTNKSYFNEKISKRLNSGNHCYHSVHDPPSSGLQF